MQEKSETDKNIRIHEKLRRDLGVTFINALHKPSTIELMLNADGSLWHEELGQPMVKIGSILAHKADAAMRTIASSLGGVVTS